MDWKSGLQAFLDNNPDLPEGTDHEQPQAPKPRQKASKLHVALERKGRGGKTATIVYGFTCSEAELADIASRLKRHLATGGSARGAEILIQGDRRAEVEVWLKENL